MLTGLDHIVILCPSIEEGEAAYVAILGREPDWRSNDPAGAASVIFQLENMALEIMAPSGGGPLARRLHILMEQDGPGLQSLVFQTQNIDNTRRLLERRSLRPHELQAGESVDLGAPRERRWSRFRIDDAQTFGVRMFVLQRAEPDPLKTPVRAPFPGAMTALDHVVVNTPNPDRALALYGARLGMHLALDRSNVDWDARLMFFRTGGVTVEIAHKLSKGVGAQPDRLWGLSWRTPDIAAAHDAIARKGLSVSEIRPGRRAGTQVFTVRDGTINVPTLILSEDRATPPA
ncbi:MAG: VOC family protein [Hyphomonadaceae bacterium]